MDQSLAAQLRTTLNTVVRAGEAVVLDLRMLVLADREAVRFRRDGEACRRIVLRNCPAYVRRWIEDLQ
jgi:hypothetical protein